MDDDLLRALRTWDAELHDCLAEAEATGGAWERDLEVLRDLTSLGQRLVSLVLAQRARLEERMDGADGTAG